MSKIISFPKHPAKDRAKDRATADACESENSRIEALANSTTICLIQQALDDARKSKNWREAKLKINAAIKRGHLHVVK